MLQNSSVCCDSIDDFNFKKLKLKKKSKFKFPEDAQVIKLNNNAYSASFELPEHSGDIYIELSSILYGVFNLKSVIPGVLYLNQDQAITHAFIPDVNIESGLINGWLRSYSPVPKDTKFVVVFAENKSNDLVIEREQGADVMMMGNTPVAIHDHTIQKTEIKSILHGSLNIKVKRFKK